jgi:hypothetical protein
MFSFFRNKRNKTSWLKVIIFVMIIIPGAVFIIAGIGNLAYIYWPTDYSQMEMPVSDPNDRHIFVLVHGVRDTKTSWSDPLQQILKERYPDARVISLEWRPYSDRTFRCSVDGIRIGKIIGHELAASKNLESMHLIGHSCGSFVILGICKAVKSVRNDIAIQTTFLDPVSVYGGLFWDYGIDNFGSCSDFSDVYIDTEDPIPGSNELIPHTITFDVTAARKKERYKGMPHVWPTAYYLNMVRSGKNIELRKDAQAPSKYPRGTLIKVSD